MAEGDEALFLKLCYQNTILDKINQWSLEMSQDFQSIKKNHHSGSEDDEEDNSVKKSSAKVLEKSLIDGMNPSKIEVSSAIESRI